MARKLLLLIVILPLINSCEHFVRILSSLQEQDQEQQRFVSEFNGLIDQVAKPLQPKDLNSRFFSNGSQLSNANYILFGENHVDLPSLIDQARAFQTLLHPGDIILVEGNNSGLEADCYYTIVFTIYAVKKWNEVTTAYDPDIFDKFRSKLFHFYKETKSQLNLNKLNLRGVSCVFWDDKEALELPVNQQSLLTRNNTMVRTMSAASGLASGHVFIKAGSHHLPSGDLDHFRHYYRGLPSIVSLYYAMTLPQLLELTLSNYYAKISSASAVGALTDISNLGLGTTKPIYKYLLPKSYIELIPKRLIKASQSCELACD